jgi:hypothetical protein
VTCRLVVSNDYAAKLKDEAANEVVSFLTYRAFDFGAAAITDVNHLNQAIGEFDRLAGFPAPTARIDHNWLFWARPHA